MLTAASSYLLYNTENYLGIILGWFVVGTCALGMFVIGHECGNGNQFIFRHVDSKHYCFRQDLVFFSQIDENVFFKQLMGLSENQRRRKKLLVL